MKILILFLFGIIFLINNVFALEIDFSCPEFVFFNKEFECLLQAKNFTGVYDVKVDISINKKNIAEIWDKNWKSAYYYLYDFIDNEEEKKIKLRIVENFEGRINGILKLRKDSKRDFFGFVIEVKDEEEISSDNVLESEIKKSEKDFNDKKKIDETDKDSQIIVETIKLSGLKEDVAESESIKTLGNIIYESKNEKIKKYSIFGFALLCVGLSVLIIFKRL